VCSPTTNITPSAATVEFCSALDIKLLAPLRTKLRWFSESSAAARAFGEFHYFNSTTLSLRGFNAIITVVITIVTATDHLSVGHTSIWLLVVSTHSGTGADAWFLGLAIGTFMVISVDSVLQVNCRFWLLIGPHAIVGGVHSATLFVWH
jgi:hypothetical protein